MDVKEEIRNKSCLLDIYSQNESNICSKDFLEKAKNETITSDTEIEETMVSQNEEEFIIGDPVMSYKKDNKDSIFEPKIKIKEEQFSEETTSTENLCIYDDIKDERNGRPYSITSPSYTSDLFPNEELENGIDLNMRKNIPEYESARKCESLECDVTNMSSIENSACSEMPGGRKIVNMPPCLEQDSLLQQNHTKKQAINEGNYNTTESPENRKLYKDEISEKCFKHTSHLENHSLIHDSKEGHKCNVCEKGFNHLSSLKRHRFIHGGKKPHKCNICDKAFIQLQHLKQHKLSHERIKAHKCNICEETFKHLHVLKRHVLMHEGIRPHKCNICDMSFSQLQHLTKHKLIHDGVKPNKCNICNKAFVYLYNLKRHNLIHEGIKPHKCNICNKAFTRLQHLKRHKLNHEDIKPHKCNICDKSFIQLEHLKRHKLIHEGIKPHKCNVCDKAFTDLGNLKRHTLIHKDKNPP